MLALPGRAQILFVRVIGRVLSFFGEIMIEEINITEHHQLIHNPRYGFMRRPVGEHMFYKVHASKRFFTRAELNDMVQLYYMVVPKKLLQRKELEKGGDCLCGVCHSTVPNTEATDGLCRECFYRRRI